MTGDGWRASYTQSAIDFIIEHAASEHVASKLFEYRRLLQDYPDLGKAYDPDYPAARPPFDCREIHVPDTPFTLYYLKNEEERLVVIFCIEFQRAQPNSRFSGVDPSLLY